MPPPPPCIVPHAIACLMNQLPFFWKDCEVRLIHETRVSFVCDVLLNFDPDINLNVLDHAFYLLEGVVSF